jgi:uncharacterized repeat protein (TIGR01451 family)
MRHYFQTAVRSILVLVISTSAFAAGSLRSTGGAVPGEVLVKIQAGASQGAVSSILAEADEGQRLATVSSGTLWRMRSNGKKSDALAAALQKNPNVLYAEPNYIVHLVTTPNDSSFSQLWGMKNTGQTVGGTTGYGGSDIDAEPAWSITTGSSSIVIGVVDTGVDYTHPDLAANMWSNPGGKGNVACAAGTHGFNAINGTCDPMDDHDHGTHVSGTIGAVGNNGIGVAGVNWTTSIMALKFLDWDGYGTTADAIKAIDFAVQAKIDGVNVRVLSNSWGGGGFSKALLDAINKANEHDILFVAAAGNDGSSNDVYPMYPASYATANMISVAATDNRDNMAWFSNYGATTVHLGAPGVNVFSTIPGGYSSFSGTSMATPHVAGVAALLLGMSPGLSTAAVKSTILNNTDPIPSLTGKTITGGRLNAAKVVGAPPSPEFALSVSPTTRTVTRGTSTTYAVTITPSGGFAGSVGMTVTGLPSGATGSFSPNPATTTSTLTVSTTNATPLNTNTLTITGVSGGTPRSVGAGLLVVATPAPGGCPAFNPALNYTAGTPTSVATGDFNRDGRADVAVAYVSANTVAVRLGTGTGTLQGAVSYSTGTAPIHVATGDFDADGKLDLAVANSGSNNVSILIGNGDGTFDAKVNYAAGTSPFAVAVGDFNNDGKSDLAVANNASSDLSILIGNGDGTFAAQVQYGTASGPFHLLAADFDRDGHADLAVAGFNSDQVSILIGNGDGTFAAAVNYAAGDAPSSVAAGDLNDDGKPDLAVSNYNSGTLSFLYGAGDGTFSPAVHRATGAGLYSVAILDFNDDAKNDLIAVNGDGSTAVVLLGAGGGLFPTSLPVTVGFEPNQVSIADFNGDGKPDFVVSNGESSTISVVLNNSACSASCGTFATATTFGVSGNPFSLTSGDFNRDGKVDFATAGRGTNNVSILLGNGNGTFASGVVVGVGTNPDSIAAGDFNRDGALDLATANSGSGNVSILLGNGNGTFQSAVNFAAGTTPRSVATADFNRDGKADLVVATSASPSVSILLGNGNGTFAAPLAVSAGTAPFSAMPGDFNRDGAIDLAVANSGSANLSILLGNGNGTFQAATNYTVGTTPRSIAVHDFDRNGKLDLAVANAGSHTISVLLGAGDGTFQAAVSYASGGEGPFHVTAADASEDDIVDLVISNNTNGGLRVLGGNGTGTFASIGQYSTAGAGPAGSVVADVDGDGKADLAVVNSGFGTVAVLRNTCPAPDLTVTKTHTDVFTQGSIGKNYWITVKNSGLLATSGLVTMTDVLPPSLTVTGMVGAGWTCVKATATCTRSDVLAGGDQYAAIMVTVSVSADAPSTITNVVNVTGGSELNTANNSASDPTAVTAVAALTVTSTHTGSFTQGATGKTYTLRVKNLGGLPTSGLVTVIDTLPTGLIATGIGGTGWSCSLPSGTCNRSDVLASGAIYPPITLTVNVATDAPAAVDNNVMVTGGGASDAFNSDPTVIWASNTCGTFGSPVYYDTGSDPYTVVADNFNHDGSSDLAVTNFYSANVSILIGKPDGSFHPAVNYPAGSYPGAMAIGQLTGDTNSDLVIANYYAGTVSVLLGNGSGGFSAPVTYTVGTEPVAVAIGDFNNDGKGDVAVTNYASQNISILLGNGSGGLQSQVTYPTGTGPRGLVAADFDGNGTSDLVVTRGNSSLIAVLLGAGDGTFAAATTHPVAYGSSTLAVGDFNQDGKRDLAVPTYYQDGVGILLGNGNGTFQPTVYYDGPYNSSNVAVEDLNGDGKTDLLVGGYSYLSILSGNGDGTFDPPSTRYLSVSGGPLAIGDFNADGKPDAAITSYYNSDVIVLLGGCADLSIQKSHTGTFHPGSNGTYSITVTNTGAGTAQGTVTVHDLLPAGLTITGMYGGDWDCTIATATCTTAYSLEAGDSYSTITVYVNVASNAAANIVNSATVSGGGDNNSANNTASDPTAVVQIPDLTISKTHVGTFAQGQTGRTYTIVVSNIGAAPTTSSVTVTDSLPFGLVATDMSGQGWSCNLYSCVRSDVLAGGASYPPITMTVSVSASLFSTGVSNYAAVSGGGDQGGGNNYVYDWTNILIPPGNLVATALSVSQVYLTWNASQHATSYQVYRSANDGPFQLLGDSVVNAFSDQIASPNTTYLYRVRAIADGTVGGFSNIDLATTVMFTDDPLVAGVTTAKVVHITELRTAVNALRATAGLPAMAFTNPSLNTSSFITTQHWEELRAGIDAARSALGLVGVTYTDPALTAGTRIKAAHLRELRSAVR